MDELEQSLAVQSDLLTLKHPLLCIFIIYKVIEVQSQKLMVHIIHLLLLKNIYSDNFVNHFVFDYGYISFKKNRWKHHFKSV